MLVSTRDGFTVTVPQTVAMNCTLLKNAPGKGIVPLHLVASEIMLRVVEYYVHPSREFLKSLSASDVVHLAEAANYLGAAQLLEDTCDAIADLLIACQTPQQMREVLMLPIDTTGEDARTALDELAWALTP